MSQVNRRDVLRVGTLGAAALLAPSWLRDGRAAPEREISLRPTLVFLYLRGGQDALGVLAPYAEGRYRDLRPNIALPAPDQPGGVLPLDDTFGFHPALARLKRLYDEKLLAPVVCVGSKHPTRSHFDAQDFMEYGAPGDRTVRSGWLNRFLAATSPDDGGEALRGVALQRRLPRSLRGPFPTLAVPDALGLDRPRARGEEGGVLDLFDPLYPADESEGLMAEEEAGPARAGTEDLVQAGRTTIDTLRRLEEILRTEPPGPTVRYPAEAGVLGRQLQRTARLLKSGAGTEIVALDWNGWDHHIQEGGPGPQDLISRMLRQLDAALGTFFEDIATMRSKVTVLVATEFGRTNAENGNRGTDHGHGGLMLVAGGRVKGGRVLGEWTTLAPGRTYQNRDLEVTTDFRTVFQEVARDALKLHPDHQLFPGFADDRKLGLFS